MCVHTQTHTYIYTFKQEVIEQYCSFKTGKGLQDVSAQEHLSTAYKCS